MLKIFRPKQSSSRDEDPDLKQPCLHSEQTTPAKRTNAGSRVNDDVITQGSNMDDSIEMEDMDDAIEGSRIKVSQQYVILHYSPFKAVWDWITLLLVVYTAFLTPYNTAFQLHEDQSKAKLNLDSSLRLHNARPSEADPLVIVDLIIDIMFLVDIIINFRTTYLLFGDVITDPQKIAVNYIKGWFFVDALAAIPFDLLLFGTGTSNTTTIAGILKISRLLRLIRVLRRIDQFSEYGSAVLLLLLATFVIISHWLACIFYAIGYLERPTLHAPIGWLDYLANVTGKPYLRNDSNSGPDIRSKYITSLYFTYTILTSVGFGNIAPVTNAEKIFSIFAMLLGSLMSAVIFGNVSSIMLRVYQGTEEQQEMQSSIKEFIRFHSIPKPLATRLIESYQLSRSYTNGIDMNSVLKGFPDCLQADICLHLNRNLLSSCKAFSGASPGCIRALSMKFRSTHAPPGDTLVHPGDILNAIYFIARGTVEIIKDGSVIAVLGKDDIFGEDLEKTYPSKGNWKAVGKSCYSVRVLTYSDLHKITLEDLRCILDVYPEFTHNFLLKFDVTFNLMQDVDNCDGSPSEKYPVSIDVRSQSMKMHKYLRRSSDHCAYQVTDINKQEKLAKHASYYGGSSDMSSDDEHKSAILVLSPELASSHLIQQGAKLSKITDKFIENKTTGATIVYEKHRGTSGQQQSSNTARFSLYSKGNRSSFWKKRMQHRHNRQPLNLPQASKRDSTTRLQQRQESSKTKTREDEIDCKLDDLNQRMNNFEQELFNVVDSILDILGQEPLISRRSTEATRFNRKSDIKTFAYRTRLNT